MRFIKTFALLMTLLAYFWVMGLLWFVGQIPRQETKTEERADAGVVLTGGSLRLERGLDLLAHGQVDRLFISGVPKGVGVAALLRAARRGADADIDSKAIVLGYEASDTQSNAEETARWAAEEGIGSLFLITADYHMPRALFELRAVLPGVRIIPEPVMPADFRREAWWQFPGTAGLVLSEYHKLLARKGQALLHVERLRLARLL